MIVKPDAHATKVSCDCIVFRVGGCLLCGSCDELADCPLGTGKLLQAVGVLQTLNRTTVLEKSEGRFQQRSKAMRFHVWVVEEGRSTG